MALTVTSDLTVITNGNDGTWGDVGGGSGSAAETDYFVQGTGCRSRAVSGSSASRGMTVDIGAGNTLDFTSGGANADELVYFWIQMYSPGLADDLATAPGLTIRMSEGATNGSDFAEWDILYSDLLSVTNGPATEFFRVYVIDPRCPPTRTSGTWDYNAVRHFGAVLDTNATAKGQNLGIDRICHGRGELRVTGTANDATSGFQEIVAANWNTVNDSVAIGSNSTARNGIISQRGAVSFIKGKILIGDDTGTLATTFTGQDNVFVWEDTYYYDATRVRSAVGYDFSGNYTGRDSNGVPYYGLSVVGNGTGDTDATFGAQVGTTQGRSGPQFFGSKITPTEFSFDDGATEDVKIYGSRFSDVRLVDFSSNAATDLLYGCNFVRCGTVDVGLVEVRNCNTINGVGASYTFLEGFINIEAAAAQALATADPTTEWTALLNGADLSVPSATAGYCELLGGTTRTNIVLLDDDKVGADNHYAEFVVNFPASGAGQGTLGPVIAGNSAAQNYFYAQLDLVNDQITLVRVNTGTDNTIAGPTAFTMDEDENYVVLLRRNGTTIEAFVSGNSAADGFHTTKVSATDSAHTGTGQRLTGIRGNALAGQTGSGPRITNFGTGPITDRFGAILLPTTANLDLESCNLINCVRGFGVDNTGTYTLQSVSVANNLVSFHNDSGGSVTGSFVGASAPDAFENLGASTTTTEASVALAIRGVAEHTRIRVVGVGGAEDENTLLEGYANSSGEVTGSFAGTTPQNVSISARNAGIIGSYKVLDPSPSTWTTQTDDARDATGANDVNLFSIANPIAVNDASYFGGLATFGQVLVHVTTAASWAGSQQWEYWNGSSWGALTVSTIGVPANDNTFKLPGWRTYTFTPPGDWDTTAVDSVTLYWVRNRVTAHTSTITRPLAEEISLNQTTKYLPVTQSGTIGASGLDVTLSQEVDPNNTI